MPESSTSSTDRIIGQSLITVETLAQDLRELIARELARDWDGLDTAARLIRVRNALNDVQPTMARHFQATELAAWLAGFDDVAKETPEWILDILAMDAPPTIPPRGNLPALGGMDGEPELRFPLIEKAADSLKQRGVLSKEAFDRVSDDVKMRSFTIAGDLSDESIERTRDVLADLTRDGASLGEFRNRIEAELESVVLPPGRIENIYRTNVQSAYRDGFESLASDPIVSEVFPYQEYFAIHDARARTEHIQLEKLGLNGTNVYRRDDPMWDSFTPPWDFQCRCTVGLLTVEAAARRGVREAKRWHKTGQPPVNPEWRINHIPFGAAEGFTAGRTAGVV